MLKEFGNVHIYAYNTRSLYFWHYIYNELLTIPYGQNGETHCYFEMLTENKNLRDFLPIGRKTEKTALKCFHSENKNVSKMKISVVVK